LTVPDPKATTDSREDDLSQTILPPLQETGEKGSEIPPPEGLRPALKRTIILFTVFTFLAFAVFSALFLKNILGSKSKEAVWDDENLTVAERLRDAGLYDQALRHYERYLDNPKLDFVTRGRVAYTTGSLYLELDNCAEGLVWLYQSQTALPDAPWAAERDGKIDACLVRLKAPPK